MDEVAHLLTEFEEENTQNLPNEDLSRKVAIIRQLEQVSDARVLPFFLRILENKQEYDLARIEVLKILELKEHNNQVEHEQIGKLIQHVLDVDTDDDVRNYAAIAISNYMDV